MMILMTLLQSPTATRDETQTKGQIMGKEFLFYTNI